MNRFENMNTFVRVVEAGTISAAADRLNVAKSAVSRRLKELEEHLDVELFHRTTRKLTLNESGRAYYERCVRILDDLTESEVAVSQSHAAIRGGIKLALPLTFGLMHVGPAINDFLNIHPDIEFDIDFSDRQVDLIEEGYDLAIRIAKLEDSSLIAKRLASVHHIFCASPDYLDRMGTPANSYELSEHQFLLYSLPRKSNKLTLINANGERFSVTVKPLLSAGTGEFLRDLAVAGQGIVRLPTFILYQQIESGELRPILTEVTTPELRVHAIYPPTRHLSRRVRTFIDFLAARFDGVPYWDRNISAVN